MKTSTEIISAADLIGEQKAIEYIARAGFDAWDFSMFSMCDYDWDKKTAILTNPPPFLTKLPCFCQKTKTDRSRQWHCMQPVSCPISKLLCEGPFLL